MLVRGWIAAALGWVSGIHVGAAELGAQPAGHCDSAEKCVSALAAASLPHGHDGAVSPVELELSMTLVTLGEPALNALVSLLEGREPRRAEVAAYAISLFGPRARPAIPALGRALDRGNRFAARALAATKSPEAAVLLTTAVRAGRPTAASALVLFGAHGQRVLGRVLEGASISSDLRKELLAAVQDAEVSTLVFELAQLAMISDAPEPNRILACDVLASLGDAARPTLRLLAAAAKDTNASVAHAARNALDAIGDPGPLGQCLAALDSNAPEPDVRKFFIELGLNGLEHLGPAASEISLALIERARRAPWDQRFLFVRMLGRVGEARAAPFLIEALDSLDWRVTLAAVRALGRLGSGGNDALPALARLERSHWLPRIRMVALETRRQLSGTTAKTATPSWYRALPRATTDLVDGLPIEPGLAEMAAITFRLGEKRDGCWRAAPRGCPLDCPRVTNMAAASSSPRNLLRGPS